MVINGNDNKLDLPCTIWKHNIFHVSMLDRYTPPTTGQPPSKPQLKVVDYSDQWEVDRIVNSKRHHRELHYLTQWAGYSYILTTSEPAENLSNAQESVDTFH
jgi:hypothetical protein